MSFPVPSPAPIVVLEEIPIVAAINVFVEETAAPTDAVATACTHHGVYALLPLLFFAALVFSFLHHRTAAPAQARVVSVVEAEAVAPRKTEP
jgi:F0F1-type ATP synthase assembly protein I